ncbi:hypothetical protein O0L34_g14891 [Tuta absoluta]|nr:hypothetical protein O0L34_g14891 [Tuta absoluta]
MSNETLPIILVSASDADAAQTIISELIDNEVPPWSGDPNAVEDGAHVWELSNKYYTARVRVCACADPTPPTSPCPLNTLPDAHIIYLDENECTSGAALSRRAGMLAGRGEGEWEGDSECAVKLALCACERDDYTVELRQAARAHGYELVSLRSAAAVSEGPFPELEGLSRAREALHAHTWASLQLRRSPAVPAPPGPQPQPGRRPADTGDDEFSPFQSYQNGVRRSSGEGGGSDGSSPEPDEAECARRGALLADALSALSAARALAAAGGDPAQRRLRAEAVMAAFARALDTDIDSL